MKTDLLLALLILLAVVFLVSEHNRREQFSEIVDAIDEHFPEWEKMGIRLADSYSLMSALQAQGIEVKNPWSDSEITVLDVQIWDEVFEADFKLKKGTIVYERLESGYHLAAYDGRWSLYPAYLLEEQELLEMARELERDFERLCDCPTLDEIRELAGQMSNPLYGIDVAHRFCRFTEEDCLLPGDFQIVYEDSLLKIRVMGVEDIIKTLWLGTGGGG